MLVKFLDGSSREVVLEPYANLHGADLCDADLHGADLFGANLRDAVLRDADLRDADLRGADLHGAVLHGADLRNADLHNAVLHGAKGLSSFNICAQGEIIGYKKLVDGSIATLRIPHDAQRVNAYSSRKCRAEFVYVVEGNGAKDRYSNSISYKTGVRVESDSFDSDLRVECGHGIHFFITREEAQEYENA